MDIRWLSLPTVAILAMPAGEPMSRVVFGNVSTFDEAKEATTEMKEAIDKYTMFYFILKKKIWWVVIMAGIYLS